MPDGTGMPLWFMFLETESHNIKGTQFIAHQRAASRVVIWFSCELPERLLSDEGNNLKSLPWKSLNKKLHGNIDAVLRRKRERGKEQTR